MTRHPPPSPPRALSLLFRSAGALLGIPITFIYPAAIHLHHFPKNPWRAANVLLITAGCLLSVICTGITIATW